MILSDRTMRLLNKIIVLSKRMLVHSYRTMILLNMIIIQLNRIIVLLSIRTIIMSQ